MPTFVPRPRRFGLLAVVIVAVTLAGAHLRGAASVHQSSGRVVAYATGPFELRGDPLRIMLTSGEPIVSLGNLLNDLGAADRIVLMLRDVFVSAGEFDVYLELTEGDIPDERSIHFLGRLRPTEPARAEAVARYDMTAAARALEPLEMRGEPTTITVVPREKVSPASGRVGRIEVVRE